MKIKNKGARFTCKYVYMPCGYVISKKPRTKHVCRVMRVGTTIPREANSFNEIHAITRNLITITKKEG